MIKAPEIRFGSTQTRANLSLKNPKDRHFLVWGTGDVTRRLMDILSYRNKKRIIGFIETEPSKRIAFGKPVYAPREILREVGPSHIVITSSYISEILKAKTTSRLSKKGYNISRLLPPSFSDYYRKSIAYAQESTKSSNISMNKQKAIQLDAAITFSIVIPTFNSDPFFLARAICSITDNSHPYHEIIISDDYSTSPQTVALLTVLEAKVERLTVIRNFKRRGISTNTNIALKCVSGRFVVFMDHDDRLREDALQYIADAIIQNPDARYFFTDEDKISMRGTRFDPYLKGGFDEILLRVQNCVSHLSVVDRETVRSVGYLDENYNGSQDWALAVKVLNLYGRSAFFHVPHVLYHWRTVPQSASNGEGVKPWAKIAGQRLVKDHLINGSDFIQLIDHPTTSFNRLYVPHLPPLTIYVVSFGNEESSERVKYFERERNENIRIVLKYRESDTTAKDKGLSLETIDYNFVRDLVNDTTITDENFILVLPPSQFLINLVMFKELYAVCVLSLSGVATGVVSTDGVDLTERLYDNRYSEGKMAFYKPSWLSAVQRSVDRCWLDFMLISVGKFRNSEFRDAIQVNSGRFLEHRNKMKNIFGYTPFVKMSI